MPTHKECINFSNGYCRLLNIPVDPDGPACPNFRPRSATVSRAAAPESYSGSAGRPPVPPHPLSPRQRRARRRSRHRRGRLVAGPWWRP